MKISYQNNIFKNNFNNFNAFSAIFNSSGDFKVCSNAPFCDILCHIEATHLTFNESLLTGFSMMRVLHRDAFGQTFNLVLVLMFMLLLPVI